MPGEIVSVKIKYEWRPHICPHCKLFGHGPDSCLLKPKEILPKVIVSKPPDQIWIPVDKQHTVTSTFDIVDRDCNQASSSTVIDSNILSPLLMSDVDNSNPFDEVLDDHHDVEFSTWNTVCREKGKKKTNSHNMLTLAAKKTSSRLGNKSTPSMKPVACSPPAPP